jgi:hypothetical protein
MAPLRDVCRNQDSGRRHQNGSCDAEHDHESHSSAGSSITTDVGPVSSFNTHSDVTGEADESKTPDVVPLNIMTSEKNGD